MASKKGGAKKAAKASAKKPAKKKAAAKKPAEKKAAKPSPPKLTEHVRGAALVDRVIEAVKAGTAEIEVFEARPVPKEDLDALTFADGSPLPDAMKRWLAFDASWLTRQYSQFGSPDDLSFPLRGWKKLIDSTIGADVWGRVFAHLRDTPLAGKGVELDSGSDSMRFLFVGKRDAHGEYPILWADVDDTPCLGIEWPGFDVWLAYQAGLIDRQAGQRIFADDFRAQGDLNLGGATEADLRGAWVGTRDERAVWEGPALDGDFEFEDGEEDEEEEEDAPPPKKKAKEKSPEDDKPVPAMKLDKLIGALTEAIGESEARTERFLKAALAQYPKDQTWRDRALAAAVEGKNLALIDRLIDLGASPNAPSSYGWTVLGTAARWGLPEVVEKLVARGANLEVQQGTSKQTALGDACDQLNLEVVKILLAHGANPNAADDNGMTPLHEASHFFQGERASMAPIVSALLDAGAKIDVQDKNRRTALHWAMESSDEVAKLLIARGANPDLTNWADETATLMAWRLRKFELLRELLARGARTDIPDREGVRLDECVGDDGITPRVFDVAYRADEAPQEVVVEAEWLRFGSGYGSGMMGRFLIMMVEKLVHAAAAGALAGDAFDPARAVGEIVEKPAPITDEKIKRYPYRWKLRLAAVSAEAMLGLVRRLVLTPYDARGIKLTIRGERPLDGSSQSIDTARARRAFNGAVHAGAWKSPGFAIERAPSEKVAVTVEFANVQEGARRIAKLEEILGESLESLALAPGRRGEPLNVKLKALKKSVEIAITSFVPKSSFPYDRDATAALLTNVFAHIHANGAAITKVAFRL